MIASIRAVLGAAAPSSAAEYFRLSAMIGGRLR
jgi:hypothetical protein